jgi:Barstar (barnase inhibitor)
LELYKRTTNSTIVEVPIDIATKQDLFDFFKGALQFPDYFGNNWDAFDECISDLSWLNAESFLIAHRDIPLASSPAEAATYLGLIENASHEQTGINFSFPLEFKKSIDNLLRNFAR